MPPSFPPPKIYRYIDIYAVIDRRLGVLLWVEVGGELHQQKTMGTNMVHPLHVKHTGTA